MKKIILSVLALSFVYTVNAQEIPDRKSERHMMHQKHRDGRHKKEMMMKQLNLTDAQKEQFKTHKESFRKQMEELEKNDNITVKEWKSKKEALLKEQKARMQSILTPGQKAQIEKIRTEKKAMHEIDAKARMEKMKIHLGLSDEQAAKIKKNRNETMEKMKALKSDDKMDLEKKKEMMKELLKKQKENMKSILTEDQLKKMKERKMRGHGEMHGKKPEKKEVI